MPLNLSNLNAIIEAQLAAADSNTSASSLVRLLSAIEERDIQVIKPMYYDVDDLPILDSDYTGMVLNTLGGPYIWSGTDYKLIDMDLSSIPPLPYNYIGNSFGYASGGSNPTNPTISTILEKYSFISDGNSTVVGNLFLATEGSAGTSSLTHGYNAGGKSLPSVTRNTIQKFPFAADGAGSNVADLTVGRYDTAGATSNVSGYTVGGQQSGNVLDKFPFAADGNATDVGDLIVSKFRNATVQSRENGYTAGGGTPWPGTTAIQRFSFTSDGNSVYSGGNTTIPYGRFRFAGVSSFTDGYFTGGQIGLPAGTSNVIDKFPFAADGIVVDHGDLVGLMQSHSATSASAYGYVAGGFITPFISTNHIQKFQYAALSNAVSVGQLAASNGGSRTNVTGQQV